MKDLCLKSSAELRSYVALSDKIEPTYRKVNAFQRNLEMQRNNQSREQTARKNTVNGINFLRR